MEMKKLFLLYVLLGLRVVTFSDEHEHIGPLPISESDGVILLSFLGDKLPLAVFGSMVDHLDIKIMSVSPIDKPNAHIGMFFFHIDYAHLAINAPRNGTRDVGSIIGNNSNGLVLKMEHRSVLGEANYRRQYNGQYEKNPLHATNITNC